MEGHVSSRVWDFPRSLSVGRISRMQDGIGFAPDGGALPGHRHGSGLFTTPQGQNGSHAYGQVPIVHGYDAHGRPSTHPQFYQHGGEPQAMHPGLAYAHPSMANAYDTPSLPTQAHTCGASRNGVPKRVDLPCWTDTTWCFDRFPCWFVAWTVLRANRFAVRFISRHDGNAVWHAAA